MVKNKLVYVIVPVYNVEKYLRRCLDSIFSQTYKEYLVICVNDGSTDSSLTILKEYKEIYKDKMVLINKSNGGLSSARNAGLDYIKEINGYNDNSYITFIDSDDWVSKDYLETIILKAEESNCDLICFSYIDDYEDREQKSTPNLLCESHLTISKALIKLYSGEIQSHCCHNLYKSFIWLAFRFDETKNFMEDQCITFKLFLSVNNIYTSKYAGYYYTHRNGSLCKSKLDGKKIISALDSYFESVNFPFDFYLHDSCDVVTKLANDLFARIFLMLYPRFSKKLSSEKEKGKMNFYISFIKENNTIILFRPTSIKEKTKRFIFLYLNCLYKPLYKLFI